MAETEQQLNCYADFCRDALAMPVVKGRKTDKEKFAGAEATYTIEAMMKDRKALQSGTSHYFGDKFSRAYDVTFTGRDNKLQYPFQTSWGSTTRLIGACIMTHSRQQRSGAAAAPLLPFRWWWCRWPSTSPACWTLRRRCGTV